MNIENPCFEVNGPLSQGTTFRRSDDLAVVCKAYRPGPSFGPGLTREGAVDDQLVCPEQYPHNLNTKSFDFKSPKTDIALSWEQAGPGFWQSSVDIRYDDWMILAKKGYEGQQQPVRQGTQNYSTTNWNPKEKTLIVWIYCSKKWASPNTFKQASRVAQSE